MTRRHSGSCTQRGALRALLTARPPTPRAVLGEELDLLLAVIDSTKVGLDAGEYLDERSNGIPILRDLAAVVARSAGAPRFFIIGVGAAQAGCSRDVSARDTRRPWAAA